MLFCGNGSGRRIGGKEMATRFEGKAFGAHGTAELIYLVSFYCLVCLTLNGYDAPVPEETA